MELDDWDSIIRDKYNVGQIEVPAYLHTKNDQLIYKFNQVLRALHDDSKQIEHKKNELFNESNRFHKDSSDDGAAYCQQVRLIHNENQIDRGQQLLAIIEKMKVLLNKLETVNKTSAQQHFLLSKLDRLRQTLLKDHQVTLPATTSIEAIRVSLNIARKSTQAAMPKLVTTRNELLQKLTVSKTKDELKRRTQLTDVTGVITLALIFIPCMPSDSRSLR